MWQSIWDGIKSLQAKDWIGFGYTTVALAVSTLAYRATIKGRQPQLLLTAKMAKEDVGPRPVASLTLEVINIGAVAVSVTEAGIRCSYGTELHQPKYPTNRVDLPYKIEVGHRATLKYLDDQVHEGEVLADALEFVVKTATGLELTVGQDEIAAWKKEASRLHSLKR